MDSSAHTERPTWRDRAAAARLQADEWRAIRVLLFRLGVEADQLDDVTQETALTLHRTTSVVERRALVWGIARNKAASHRRTREKRRRVFEETAPLMRAQPSPTAEDLAIAHGQSAILHRAIEELKDAAPRLHEVLSLYLDGLTVAEIAAMLPVPRGTAETRFRRARMVLRETVRRWTAEDARRERWALLTKGARKRWS